MTTQHEPVDIKLVRGNPTDEELAAVLAVLSLEYEAEAEASVAAEKPNEAWHISGRGMRLPIRRDLGWVRSRPVRW